MLGSGASIFAIVMLNAGMVWHERMVIGWWLGAGADGGHGGRGECLAADWVRLLGLARQAHERRVKAEVVGGGDEAVSDRVCRELTFDLGLLDRLGPLGSVLVHRSSCC